ncbi:vWA domain-containing protein [Kiritimatiella glycovorans]|uniref:Mg-chelatase subunit ChlD n=1 Tax=Kiritimatiella glycovorans TaxID=1307763 RepID=A0A0G3ED71_9BACT|nr:VWA domain-containing protein [Kiritimatiella glycovorans]AKJ64268.1 Mg-chelatase subunit ChlD [Kiritimatiella glycovorans]
MSFAHPWILLLLPAALTLLRRRRGGGIPVSSLADWRDAPPPGRVRWLAVPRMFAAFAAALLITAMAGPRVEKPVRRETREGIAIEMLLDISSSMDQSIDRPEGGNVTRMEAAKEAVAAFIDRRPDDLIGLITFARYADTLSPLTFGHEALIDIVRRVEIQDRPHEDGTAYGDALAFAAAQLHRMENWGVQGEGSGAEVRNKVIVLLTDGENNCGRHLPRQAAGMASQWDIRIYGISLGRDAFEPETQTGRRDPELTEGEALLKSVCTASGGAFWKIRDAGGLTGAYETIDRLETSAISTAIPRRVDYASISARFLLPALVLLLAAAVLRSTVLRVAEEERG